MPRLLIFPPNSRSIAVRVATQVAVDAGWEVVSDPLQGVDAQLVSVSGLFSGRQDERLGKYYSGELAVPSAIVKRARDAKVRSPQWVGLPSFTWDHRLFADDMGHWLDAISRGLEGRRPPPPNERALIEVLHREVELGLIENVYLKALIADLVAQLAQVTGHLTEAQMEIRTLEALHAQLEKQNEALLKELSKSQVQPESASLLARGIKVGAVSLVSLAITVGGTYAGTKAALPEEQVAQLQETQQTIVNQCNQVIQIVGDGD